MNDETAMAGGKVSRPVGGNEPALTDKSAAMRQFTWNIAMLTSDFASSK